MSNTPLTMTFVSKTAVAALKNSLRILRTVNTGYENDVNSSNGGWNKGGVVTVRRPNRYTSESGSTISSYQDIEERSTTLTVDQQEHVAVQVTSRELQQDYSEKFAERVIQPAMDTLANKVEGVVIDAMQTGYNYFAGTAGTAPSTIAPLTTARALMNLLGIPQMNRYLAWNETDYATFIAQSGMQNNFNTMLNNGINKSAQIGSWLGMDHFTTQLTPSHIAGIGDFGETPASGFVAAGNVKTTVTSGTAIIVENLTASKTNVFRAGDKIKIAGVYSVNPQQPTRSTGTLMQFTVTAAVDSSAGGEATIAVTPSIVSSSTSPYRNISVTTGIAGSADSAISIATGNSGAASATLAAYRANFMYHKDAVAFAAPPMMLPPAAKGDSGVYTDPDTGISIRTTNFYTGGTDLSALRFDVLYGYTVFPEYIVGLHGGI